MFNELVRLGITHVDVLSPRWDFPTTLLIHLIMYISVDVFNQKKEETFVTDLDESFMVDHGQGVTSYTHYLIGRIDIRVWG